MKNKKLIKIINDLSYCGTLIFGLWVLLEGMLYRSNGDSICRWSIVAFVISSFFMVYTDKKLKKK